LKVTDLLKTRHNMPGKGCWSYLLEMRKALVVPLWVLSLKGYTARVFAVPIRVLNRKTMIGDNVLCKNWYFLGEKKFTPTKPGDLGISYSLFSKFQTSTPVLFYGSPPPPVLDGPPPPVLDGVQRRQTSDRGLPALQLRSNYHYLRFQQVLLVLSVISKKY